MNATPAQVPGAIKRTLAFGFVPKAGQVVHAIIVTERDGKVISTRTKCGAGRGQELEISERFNGTTCLRCQRA